MQAVKLVSFKLCPFVQRVIIVLKLKNINYDITYIDLADPPQWFLDISPFAKVPILETENTVLFESTAISEYLEDAFSPKLHPSDLITRAKHRSWISVSNELTMYGFQLSVITNKTEFEQVRQTMLATFDQLEQTLTGSAFWQGEQWCLLDANFAPFWQRLAFLQAIKPDLWDSKQYAKCFAWQQTLLASPLLKQSCVPEIETLYYQLVAKRQGYISQYLDADKYPRQGERSTY